MNRNMKKLQATSKAVPLQVFYFKILHTNKSCSVHLFKSDMPSAEVLNNLNSYTPMAKLFPSNSIDLNPTRHD